MSFVSGFGDIYDPFVVSTDVLGLGLVKIDKYFRLLSGAFKVQQRASIWEGISEFQVGAVPALSAIVAQVRINSIACVKAMWNFDPLPVLFAFGEGAMPDIPRPTESTATVLPSGYQSLRILLRAALISNRCRRRSECGGGHEG